MSIIVVTKLSKKYMIGHNRFVEGFARFPTFRESLTRGTIELLQRIRHRKRTGGSRGTPEEFWALNDINFEVQRGERVGIIGRNGAGKSTLLKVLSRITEPTTGRIEIDGRVASLLEVGTGFHPELSGRENIFLNGAVLGMSRAEIRSRFDEIVAFADVERFLDTPVKRYSSGMYVRLAFSVAAHLESEILIVDEVLAVGDAAFQQKCFGKMEDVTREGRTILFVSHNMAAIRQLCTVGILLEAGRLVTSGEISSVVETYLQRRQTTGDLLAERSDRIGDGRLRFVDLKFKNKDGHVIHFVETDKMLVVELRIRARDDFPFSKLTLGIAFFDLLGSRVLSVISDELNADLSVLETNDTLKITIPNLVLRPGVYRVDLFASAPDTQPSSFCDVIEGAAKITVSEGSLSVGARPIRNHDCGVFQRATFD